MKKSMKKVFAVLLLAVVLVASVAAQAMTEKAPYFGKTVILHTNDVHGALEGYAYIPVLREKYEALGATVIVVDAGDFSQGSVYVSTNKGSAAVELMNAAGYDIVTLGNHEFDYGVEVLMSNLSKAQFAAICDDVFLDGKTILNPYVSIKTGIGNTILFVGIETPETQTKVNPGLIQSVKFLDDPEIWTETQRIIDEAKAAGLADTVIVMSHLGIADESLGYRSIELFNKVSGIDFAIDGHSHSVMTSPANIIASNGAYTIEKADEKWPIQSTGTKFENIGVVIIDNFTGKIVDNYLIPTEGLEKDPIVDAIAKVTIDYVDELFGAVFAQSEVELAGTKDANRGRESNHGDLIADALRWKVVKDLGDSVKVPRENVVAIQNGGGIRTAIKVGPVTMKDVKDVMPFGNTLACVYVKGSVLLEVLEASTFSSPTNVGGFPQVSGINYTIDTTKAFDEGPLYPASTYHAPNSIQRVTINDINGQPFDPEALYLVASNDFCASGGDTYYALKATVDKFDTGVVVDEVVVEYITDALGGVIGAEYAEPAGRITIIK